MVSNWFRKSDFRFDFKQREAWEMIVMTNFNKIQLTKNNMLFSVQSNIKNAKMMWIVKDFFNLQDLYENWKLESKNSLRLENKELH